MTHFTQRNLHQTLTYWAPSNPPATNDFGHPILAAGVVIKGRWEDKIQQIRKLNGEEVTSAAEVLVDRSLDVGGYLKVGDYATQAWAQHQDAVEIQDARSAPDLRNLGTEWKVFL